MGGYGSGMGIRLNTNRTKAFVEQYRVLDAKEFPSKLMQTIPPQGRQASVFGIPLRILRDGLEVYYENDKVNSYFKIPFSLTQGNYGNSRYWLICPNTSCSKRCRQLFLAKDHRGIPVFVCRHCLNLAYRSQNKSFLDRLINKKWKIIKKLKAECSNFTEKPKGMHWKTFENLKRQVNTLDDKITYGIACRFGMI